MIIETEPPFALSLEIPPDTPDISPVVVAKQQSYIIGHFKPRIVVALNLSKDGPKLRYRIFPPINVLDYFALALNHLFQSLHIIRIIPFAHGHIAIAPHTNGHQIIIGLVALHSLTEELVYTVFVYGIIPRADSTFSAKVFLMGAHHRLVVRCPHHDTILIGQSRTFRIILIKVRCPHGRPKVIGFQTQEEFKDVGVCFGVYPSKVVLAPSAKRRPFVVDKNSTVFHFRGRLDDSSSRITDFIPMTHRSIGHPVPWRHAHLLRKGIDTVNGSPLVASRYHEIAVHCVNQIGFPLIFDLTDIDFLLFDQLPDESAFPNGSYNDISLIGIFVKSDLCCCTRHFTHIITQIVSSTNHSFPIVIVQ